MTLLGDGLFQVENREGHEDIRLKEGYEELEEPERDNDETSDSDPSGREECSDVGHDSDENDSGEDIGEKTDGEREHSGEFSDEVEPSDRYVDEFLDHRMSGPIEEVVSEVVEEPLVPDSGYLCDDDDGERHDDGRIEIGIDRSEVLVRSFDDEVYPVESESEDIGEEDVDEESSHERKESPGILPILESVEEEIVDTLDEVDSDIAEPWEGPSLDGSKKESDPDEKDDHEHPHRKDRVGNRDSCNRKAMDRLSLDSRDMDFHLMSFRGIILYFARHRKLVGKP